MSGRVRLGVANYPAFIPRRPVLPSRGCLRSLLGVFQASGNDQGICTHHYRDRQHSQVFHFIFAFFFLGESPAEVLPP